MADLPHVLTSLGGVREHTWQVAEEVCDRWTLYYVWGDGPSGEHAEGRALDFMTYQRGGGVNSPGPVRIKLGREIADYLWANRERLGVWYVIYRQHIISQTRPDAGWKRMADRGDPTANHMDHVHVSFYNDVPTYHRPGRAAHQEEDDMQLSEIVKIGQWVKDRWPKDKGIQDGIQVETALSSGYAHARSAHENTQGLKEDVAQLTKLVQGLADKIESMEEGR